MSMDIASFKGVQFMAIFSQHGGHYSLPKANSVPLIPLHNRLLSISCMCEIQGEQ